MEMAEQFMNPPDGVAEPSDGRLHP
jgi:hypothetical protein